MNLTGHIEQSVFQIRNERFFNELALKIFQFQYGSCQLYKEMSDLLGLVPGKVEEIVDIPFLPVSFFREHKIISGDGGEIQKVFTSSGTTGSIPSQHFIKDLSLYKKSFLRSFGIFYGQPEQYRILALLPGYLERQGSSLVYMLDHLIRLSEKNGSGFYLHDMELLHEKLHSAPPQPCKTILFGASYALLDFAELYPSDLHDVIIMETGGMKGRGKEMVREELHKILCEKFNVEKIHSEYGMTELLSQAYSNGEGIFRTPPWMKILIRDINDPMGYLPPGKTGGVNIIDLANLHSTSFIATQDLGRIRNDGSFEIVGRFDNSDIRGCNLLVV